MQHAVLDQPIGGRQAWTRADVRDRDYRVILSDALKDHAGITEAIAFVGLGHKFQIWEPGRFRSEFAAATAKVRAFKHVPSTRMAAAEKPLGAREE